MFDNEDKVVDPATQDTTSAATNGDEPLLKVGDRVFKTKEDLAKYVENAQSHIERIQSENAQYRKQVEDYSKIQQRIDEMAAKLNTASYKGDDADNDPSRGAQTDKALGLDEVRKVVGDVLSEAEQQRQLRAQQEAIQNRLAEAKQLAESVHGAGFKERMKEIAKEKGVTSIDRLAESEPELFKEIFIKPYAKKVNVPHGRAASTSVPNLPASHGQPAPYKQNSSALSQRIAQRMAEIANQK